MRRRWSKRDMGVRAKFITMLGIATACPLVIGLVSLHFLGQRYFIREKGRLYQSVAEHLAETLKEGILSGVGSIQQWTRLSRLNAAVEALSEHPALLPVVGTNAGPEILELEAKWPSLGPADPEVAFALTNQVARLISEFKRLDLLFAEVLVTDRYGRLIGASNKTTDYWQSDEPWWQKAVAAGARCVWIEGIHFDESARVHSIDVAVPLWSGTSTETTLVGVVKGVLDVTPLLTILRSERFDERPTRMVVTDDGLVLASLSGPSVTPFAQTIGAECTRALRERRRGNGVIHEGDGKRLLGFAPLHTTNVITTIRLEGIHPMYVVVSDDMRHILAPLNRNLMWFSLAGILIVLLCALAGLVVADRGIVRPIRILQKAAGSISASARLAGTAGVSASVPHGIPLRQKDVRRVIAHLDRIQSGDEFGELARDFRLMADRVLRYHEQLEHELQERSEAIQGDLVMAREFQEAMLPHTYPTVPLPRGADSVELRFHHVYMPALSVGGDFFDVVRLSRHRAGVFIADVMGHGARSALITAILRTLLQNISTQESLPSKVLSRINSMFCEVVPSDLDMLFATAAYMILDTSCQKVTYSLAGHHAPWVIHRSEGRAVPLSPTGGEHPAIGLTREVEYCHAECEMIPGDIFLLFTDGVTEAPNPEGEEFGESRLRQTIEANLELDAAGILDAVVDELHAHMSTVISPDDICLVSIEAAPLQPA